MNLRSPSLVAPAWLLAACVCILLGRDLAAKEPPATDFERDVLPILTKHCVKCHGAKQPKGGLRLDDGRAALAGGDSGVAIVPGKPAASLLLERVNARDAAERMPAEAAPLSSAEIATLRSWIERGANWPGSERATATTHWSLRPIARPAVPAGNEEGNCKNPIDRFIYARLAAAGLTPSPEADRRTLLRRLSFDLIGLPPTPDELAAFLADRDPRAYENLVDRLLASPRHGERWAQHWLDAVRFAESDGFETNKPRANAWPYRDYVIAALNADLPYDRFVREQLAGDVLGADAATGFLVGGANDVVKSPDPVLTAQQRADVLHDMVSTTASAMLGMTVGCARCHNHKFDPIPQADYYAIAAVFAGVEHGERPLPTGDGEQQKRDLDTVSRRLAEIDGQLIRWEPLATAVKDSASPTTRKAVHPRLNIDRFASVVVRRLRMTIHKTTNLEPCLDELEVYAADGAPRNVALASAGVKARSSSVYPNSTIHRLEHINDGQLGNGRSWISAETGQGWVELEFPEPTRIEAVRWGRDRQEKYSDRLPLEYTIEVAAESDDWQVVATAADRQAYVAGSKFAALLDLSAVPEPDREDAAKLLEERTRLQTKHEQLAYLPQVYSGLFSAEPGQTHRLHRGDPMQPREAIEPGALRAVPVAFAAEAGSGSLEAKRTADQSRRLALADWIVDPANPLTARVIVNRLWQHHFGEGLVVTPSDFGANGAAPSHPELLDWLAVELVENGWSLRHIHRLIVTSATYRQASAARSEALAVDAQSRLLWRFSPRRLEAEPLRDALLAVSGQLDGRMGGPGFLGFEPNDNYVRVYNAKQSFGPADWRRMIYMTKIRMQQEGTFGAFDCPDGGQIAPRRASSTTPLQALNLLNSPFVLEQAAFFGQRVADKTNGPIEEQVRRAFLLAAQREPTAEELVAASTVAREHGLAALCRALVNSNEFLFVF